MNEQRDEQQENEGASVPARDETAQIGANLSRRSLLGGAGGLAAAGAAGVLLPSIAGVGERADAAPFDGGEALTPVQRRKRSYQIRVMAARDNLNLPIPAHPDNGDEDEYVTKVASFCKGLPHDSSGEVDLGAYAAYRHAIDTWNPDDFEAIPHGCPDLQRRMKFVNPQAGLAYDLEGTDAHQFAIAPAPRFHSAWQAGEMVENYWMALLRDVPFEEYATHPLALQACAELSALSDFRGPKQNGLVTPQTLFRESLPGSLKGPYLAQFFWKSQPFGAQYVEPRMRTTQPYLDYLTTESEWLEVQNGIRPLHAPQYDPQLRYMRTGRDLAQWVHIDVLYQAYFQAALALAAPIDPGNPFTGGGLGCPPNPGNPYAAMLTQDPFGTFGGPYLMTILCEVATRALKAVWFQKWFVHRRLRPEEFAGRIHFELAHGKNYPIHADVLNSQVLAQVHAQTGSSFLPMAFPEGCPIHPSYGAGHATVAGACVTLLKGLFCETYVIPEPVVPTADGLSLVPYAGPDQQLTVRGELDKLAYNVAAGRNIAGVHWRTDMSESLRLGEEVALSLLRDQKRTYNEPFTGFILTKFDGTQVVV